jgi:starvation-inducible DNA-binding protein
MNLLADHEAAIRLLREDARKCSEEHEDEGTFELLVSVMSLHEKMAWMLRSYLEIEPNHDGKLVPMPHLPVDLSSYTS